MVSPVWSVFQVAMFNLGRVIVSFSLAFLVPMAWAWVQDSAELVRVWGGCFALTLASGGLIWWRGHRHRH